MQQIAVAEALGNKHKRGGHGQLVSDRIKKGAELRAEIVFPCDIPVSKIRKA